VIAPVETKVRAHGGYTKKTALYLGYLKMFTSSGGNEYGPLLGGMLSARTARISAKAKRRGVYQGLYRAAVRDNKAKYAKKIKANNLGTAKFVGENRREMLGIKTYVNAEINRMIRTEEPAEIVVPARGAMFGADMARATRHKLSRWVVGYVRKRLADKCSLNGIKLTEVGGAHTSRTCAGCGGAGRRVNRQFVCAVCGVRRDYAHNGAQNLMKKSDGAFKAPEETAGCTENPD